MDVRQMREIPIADFLSAMGIQPSKQKGNALWYEAVSKHLFCHGLFLYCRLYLPYKLLSVFIFLVENVVQKVPLRQVIGFNMPQKKEMPESWPMRPVFGHIFVS